MNRKGQIAVCIVVITLLLAVCALLAVLILSAGNPVRQPRPTLPPPTEAIPASTDAPTEAPAEAPTEAPTALPTEATEQAPTSAPEQLQRVDAQPITDQETVRRLSAYAQELTETDQVLLVVAEGTEARVTLHEKGSDGLWHTTCIANGRVGKNGAGQVFEGSGKTPTGVYGLSIAFGIREDPGAILPYTQVNASHYWVDDPDSAYYNQFVSTEDVEKDWVSAEHLIDYHTAYAYAIAIDYNLERVPGAGSAFFVHCGTGRATLGCVSVSEADMIFLLQTIGDRARIVIENDQEEA